MYEKHILNLPLKLDNKQKNQLHAVSRTQQSRQTSLPTEFFLVAELNSGLLPWCQSEVMKLLFLLVGDRTHNRRVTITVPLRYDGLKF